MNLIYKRAEEKDIEILTRTRLEVLRAANQLSPHTDMTEVEKQTVDYYSRALFEKEHIAILVYDDKEIVGAGGVSFYQVMPTFHNPSGKKAYIMNMYTKPEYRRRGIAWQTLNLLVKAARQAGVPSISLEATEAGRPLYEAFGFVPMEHEMELPV